MILDKVYDASQYEDKIYKLWLESGFFNPDNLPRAKARKPYTIILPPPNITDKLHLGHAAMLAIEDLLIRYQRLAGRAALWLPGTDHAAIATQTVVEKKLKQSQRLTRHDLGREEFLKRVWSFVDETQAVILNQLKSLGASLDWSRLAFTLDEPRQAAVKEMFCRLHEAGLLYRGERIVNWCPRCASTLADDEVEYETKTATLYTFRYDKNFPLAVATTRPETKLGDSGVAVNPSDQRYRDLIGKTYAADFCGVKLNLRVIGDRQVDQNFGSGVVGLTPAHSAADWQMAEANDLPVIKVIDENGLIKEGFGEASGLTAVAARELIVNKLRAAGLMEKEEPIEHNLSLCYRCGTPIEPLPSKQWFVAVNKPVARLGGQSLSRAARQAAEDGRIKFEPARFTKRYLDWLDNLRDWCVSRQIWFGHSLPVWYCESHQTKDCLEPIVSREEVKSCPYCGGRVKQDPDTLDTWFSSGMWTFSTLGWPDNLAKHKKTGDLARFHPTQVLETGYELITLWVSRMVMMSLFAVGEIPFEVVYLHGMILDRRGKKMSKSKGNGIDPVDMVKSYGADAVRLSLLIGNTPGTDSRVSEEKIAANRNFVNKFWNIARFILSQIEKSDRQIARPRGETLADRWILSRLDNLIATVTAALDDYDFARAGEALQDFTWSRLADWYLEIAKIEGQKQAILAYILEALLKLWHPFMPLVTEAIWQTWPADSLPLLVADWPQVKGGREIDTDLSWLQEVVTAIRNARSANHLSPSQKITVLVKAANTRQVKRLMAQVELIKGLRTGVAEIITDAAPDRGAIYCAAAGFEIYLLVQADQEEDRRRLEKEFVRWERHVTRLEAKLNNREYIAKAPAALVSADRDKLTEAQSALRQIKERL